MFRHCHPIILLIGLTGCFLALDDANCATVPEPGDMRGVGKVEFPISCAPAVQSEFARGVALLHSFFYEEARRVFTALAERDPKCAMAQWGIARSEEHTSELQSQSNLVCRLLLEKKKPLQPPAIALRR